MNFSLSITLIVSPKFWYIVLMPSFVFQYFLFLLSFIPHLFAHLITLCSQSWSIALIMKPAVTLCTRSVRIHIRENTGECLWVYQSKSNPDQIKNLGFQLPSHQDFRCHTRERAGLKGDIRQADPSQEHSCSHFRELSPWLPAFPFLPSFLLYIYIFLISFLLWLHNIDSFIKLGLRLISFLFTWRINSLTSVSAEGHFSDLRWDT